METLNSLGVNFTALIWHTINFLLLLLILGKFVFPKITKTLDERSNRIRESIAQAETLKEETARLNEEARQAQSKAWQDAQQALSEAQRNAEQVIAEARDTARQEAEALIARARTEIQAERDRAFQELRQEVADLAVSAASHVVARSLDDASHRQLVEQFLAEGGNGARTA